MKHFEFPHRYVCEEDADFDHVQLNAVFDPSVQECLLRIDAYSF